MFYLSGKRLCVASFARSGCKKEKKQIHLALWDSEGSAEPSEPGCRSLAAVDGFLAARTLTLVTAPLPESEYLPL